MKLKWSLIVLGLVLLAYPCAAATLLIPSDFATINEALAAAMPVGLGSAWDRGRGIGVVWDWWDWWDWGRVLQSSTRIY